MTRPFRFGAILHQPMAGLSWADTARKVEDLGFSVLTVPDHFGDQMAVTPALTAAAAATTTLRVGPMVYCNDYRHPLVLAQEMATLDVLSGGRLEFGLGAGWMLSDYEASGIAYDRPGLRIDRMEEALNVVYGLFAAEPLDHVGKHYTIRNHAGMPKPVQQPPPLFIGGGGPKMLGVAARRADIVGVNPSLHTGAIDDTVIADTAPDRFDTKIDWVREAAGDRFDQIELNVLVQRVQITSGDSATRQALEEAAAIFGRTPEQAAQTPLMLLGTPEEIANALQQRRERWGFSYVTMPSNADFDALAPVISELHGQ